MPKRVFFIYPALNLLRARTHGQKGTQICDPLANKCPWGLVHMESKKWPGPTNLNQNSGFWVKFESNLWDWGTFLTACVWGLRSWFCLKNLGNLFDKGTFIWDGGSFIWQGRTYIWQERTFILRRVTILLQIIMGAEFWSFLRALNVFSNQYFWVANSLVELRKGCHFFYLDFFLKFNVLSEEFLVLDFGHIHRCAKCRFPTHHSFIWQWYI